MADGVPDTRRRAERSLSLQALHQVSGPYANGRKKEMAVAEVEAAGQPCAATGMTGKAHGATKLGSQTAIRADG